MLGLTKQVLELFNRHETYSVSEIYATLIPDSLSATDEEDLKHNIRSALNDLKKRRKIRSVRKGVYTKF